MPRQRNKHVAIKVTEQEFIRLKERVSISGLTQTQYALHALLYGRVVVTGTRENIDYIIRRIEEMEIKLHEMFEEIQTGHGQRNLEEVKKMREEYTCVLQALLDIVKEANIQVKN